ncbi:MAG: hypothetical protein LBD08_07700, partial [Treponema sp.]|nr:hypothetical protein [Treponema sp.]
MRGICPRNAPAGGPSNLWFAPPGHPFSCCHWENSLLGISAKTGAGLPRLSGIIAERLRETAGGVTGEDRVPGIGTARQKELTGRAAEALREALALAARGEPLDVIAPLLREGISALGEITGEVSTADILETMFSRFC